MKTSTRNDLTTKAKELGEAVYAFRMTTLEAGAPFVGGVVRAAEESLLVAHKLLSDHEVDDTEL